MAIKITLRLKLMPRFIPQGLEGYKRNRASRLCVAHRSSDDEWLNIWDKDIEVPDILQTIAYANMEVGRLRKTANFIIKDSPDYGDMLIGYIKIHGSTDYYMSCYVNVKKLKP